ncbi:membrane protein [Mycolicibacterium aurum]|uniref:Membrane protein n=1 Tax=Mycolicibacterium aurum TaxID=1791 RepID=A0A448IPM5_MYCAU|nr:YetF domain-containing protein [Mycolicibacterium aurum]VEG54364.1 membrane protein [Mycolicibacterium aurum]
MWFDSWADVVRVVSVGAAAYVTVIVILRLTGKRTLAKLNAFDLVVTVAVGSTLATILLNSDVSFVEGATALALLATLQFVAATVASRLNAGRSVLTARPTLLVSQGRLLDDALTSQRVSVDEIRQVIRSSGQGDVSQVVAVVLESDGSLSVITADKIGDGSALSGVQSTPVDDGRTK